MSDGTGSPRNGCERRDEPRARCAEDVRDAVVVLGVFAWVTSLIWMWWVFFPNRLPHLGGALYYAPVAAFTARLALVVRAPLAVVAVLLAILDTAEIRRGTRKDPSLFRVAAFGLLLLVPTLILLGLSIVVRCVRPF